ncbi:uncharacterized protein LOC135835715 [Planococcus citri]|uniref:uncharacterized protein LOC135835715 n=1 Tax=Planococcus citri TaxID=170843 RepID=UPI0031F7BB1B
MFHFQSNFIVYKCDFNEKMDLLRIRIRILRKVRYVVIIAAICILCVCFFRHKKHNLPLQYILCSPQYWAEELDEGFEGFDNTTGAYGGQYIIPNYVHFLRYGPKLKEVSFVDAVNILAAFKNQKPDKIIFHTNIDSFTGKFWRYLTSLPKFNETIVFKYIEPIDSIFGRKMYSKYRDWHSSDILRIEILQKYGGIFIDNDVYVVQKLDRFRRYEMVLETIADLENFGTMTLMAHKGARFLRLWLNEYKEYYPHLWYYNAGKRAKLKVLDVRPELVHDARGKFGVEDLRTELYLQKWKQWKDKYTIHTLIRHLHDRDDLRYNNLNLTYPVVFDQYNILKYNVTIKDMILDCCKELVFLE